MKQLLLYGTDQVKSFKTKEVTRFWEQCLVRHFYMFCKTPPRHGCWPCSAAKYFMSDFYFPQKPKYFKLQLLLPPGNSVSPPKPPPDSSEHLSVLTYRFAVLCFININGYYIRCQLGFFLTSGMVQFKSLGNDDKKHCQQHNGPRPVYWPDRTSGVTGIEPVTHLVWDLHVFLIFRIFILGLKSFTNMSKLIPCLISRSWTILTSLLNVKNGKHNT